MLALAIVAGGIGFLALKRGVNAPVWVLERVENQLNAAVSTGSIGIGGVRLELVDGLAPDLVFTDVVYVGADGKPLAQVDFLHAEFVASPLLAPEFLPRRVTLSGAHVGLRRDHNGALNIAFGESDAFAASGNLEQIIRDLKSLFQRPLLAKVEDLSATGIAMDLRDAYSGKEWSVAHAEIAMNLAGQQIDLASNFLLSSEEETPARIAVSLSAPLEGLAATVTVNVQGVEARDVALQSPALSWLGVLDAPISGALRTGIKADGTLGALNGTLEIGAGALQPTQDTRPIPFQSAKTYFSYDSERAKIRFDTIEAQSDAGAVSAQGFAYLQDWDGARPATMITQVQFSKVVANPSNLLPEPAVFDGGALDFRLRLDPFSVSIGQLSLTSKERAFLIDGDVAAREAGWELAVNAKLNAIDHDSLLAIWPVRVAPRTRTWLNKNVSGGAIRNVVAAIRMAPNQELRTSLGYEFDNANVKYLNTLPPVSGGRGYVSLLNKDMTISVDTGTVFAPNGGALDVSGTVIKMADVTLKPTPMEIEMNVRGEIPTALSLLDMDPFNFVTKAGRTIELASGAADLTAKFRFDIVKKVLLKDVDYDVQGHLTGVTSDRIISGKTLTAAQLDLLVSPEGLRISGPGFVGNGQHNVPFNVAWTQGFGPENKDQSKVTGDVEISADFLRAFGLGLPVSMLSGAGIAQIEIDMQRGRVPRFSLRSDLNRLGVRIDRVGWSSPKNATGSLAISGQLGQPARIDDISFDVSGLSAKGSVDLDENGGLKRAEFERAALAGVFDVSVIAEGRGAGNAPEIRTTGGYLDLRKFNLAGDGNAAQTKAGSLPLHVGLDRLRLSDSLYLGGFQGDFTQDAGLKGTFVGSVNGAAPVSGTVAQAEGGTAIRMRSQDAGAVLRAAGLYSSAYGGAMDLVLAPRGPSGIYDGRFAATDLRVRDDAGIAALLSAVSVIGLLEQMQESGLLFSEVFADFVLTPNALSLTSSGAVGASMGLSLAGDYDFESQKIDMQGVLSPLYLVNSIGSFFTRRGEGLFGFNFRLTGTSAAPKTEVNPFSILTPGMFREIFRLPPPSREGAPSE